MSSQSTAWIHSLLKRIRRQPLAAAGVALLAAFVLCGLAAPHLAPYNPAAIDLLHRLEGPSAAHLAGTDELGRDTLSRLLWGARLSLAISVTGQLFPGKLPDAFRAGVSGHILNHATSYQVLTTHAPFPLARVTEPPIEGVRLLLART